MAFQSLDFEYFFHDHMVELSQYHKMELMLHLFMISHITSTDKEKIAAKQDGMIY